MVTVTVTVMVTMVTGSKFAKFWEVDRIWEVLMYLFGLVHEISSFKARSLLFLSHSEVKFE